MPQNSNLWGYWCIRSHYYYCYNYREAVLWQMFDTKQDFTSPSRLLIPHEIMKYTNLWKCPCPTLNMNCSQSGCGHCTSEYGYKVGSSGHCTSEYGYKVGSSGHCTSEYGYKVGSSGHCTSEYGYKVGSSGHCTFKCGFYLLSGSGQHTCGYGFTYKVGVAIASGSGFT